MPLPNSTTVDPAVDRNFRDIDGRTTDVEGRLDTLEAVRPATSTVEDLKVIRGIVNSAGTVNAGSGFTATKNATGDYTITYSAAFVGVPAVTAIVAETTGALAIKVYPASTPSTSAIEFLVFNTSTGASTDAKFQFIAIGPR